MAELCPCGSGSTYKTCCKPLHLGLLKAKTAEQLMRSRYTAFAFAQAEYLVNTHHVSTRKSVSKSSILDWAKSTKWTKLEIVSTKNGLETDLAGVVEFKAYYFCQGKAEIHHETSNFIKDNETWFYVDGSFD